MTAPKWYAVVEKATGVPVSFGTVLAEVLPAHLEAIPIEAQPSKAALTRWDAATKAIVAIPPPVPPPDRVGAFLADATVQALFEKLSSGERAALADKLRSKLG